MTKLPKLPDNDDDFTPDIARKILAKYQQLLIETEGQLKRNNDLLANTLEYLEAHTDEGPDGEGWKSDRLRQLIKDIYKDFE